ncbi:cell division protein FtsL [Stigmatella sp. ncwal1]|uniref:Cell division protein FtsL n=1 Tax=Stigmatella ashevillensis TaxID=2995309 RepID=A0ABT5DB63_9BACT|nr:cell division protein FtsL [Stigmatella ashevillena]MDC0709592.1 cell division protein FtsL [Stigmatella ashevillena]
MSPVNFRNGASVGRVLLHLLPAVFLFALFAAVGILHVTSRVMVVDMGYRLSREESEGRTLTRENDRLKLELATLRAPSRLERVAREQLGMAMPSGSAVVALSPELPGPRRTGARAEARTAPGLRVAERGDAR